MTGDVHVVDYGHTNKAEVNRVKKARTLARWCYDRDLTVEDVGDAAAPTLRAWARAAGVLPPSTGETWDTVIVSIGMLEVWAGHNPEHPSAARPHADERSKWLTAHAAIPTDPSDGDLGTLHGVRVVAHDQPEAHALATAAMDAQLATVTTLPVRQNGPESDEPADPAPSTATPLPVPAFAPRGWDACVALGPILRKDARCHVCGGPAVAATHREWRCAGHPPQPGQWGAGLDFTPNDLTHHPNTSHRCYAPRCPSFTLTTAPPTAAPDTARSRRR